MVYFYVDKMERITKQPTNAATSAAPELGGISNQPLPT